MNEKKTQNRKSIIIGLSAFAALVIAAVALFLIFGPKANKESGPEDQGTQMSSAEKISVCVKVYMKDGTEKSFDIKTDAQNLKGVLIDGGIITEKDVSSGFVNTVNGQTADYTVDGGWWCFTKSGEMLLTGVDDTAVSDGDIFEITYTIG